MIRKQQLVQPLLLLVFLLVLLTTALLLAFFAGAFSPAFVGASEEISEKKITVVLDAGHGGEDGGTVSGDGILEKDLNLQIAKKLQTLLEANGVAVVMTRETDTLLYDRNSDYKGHKKEQDLAARRQIGEQTENCVFVSIHMNSYPVAKYKGLQVWYSKNNQASKQLADKIQSTIATHLQPQNDRTTKAATSGIYLLHHLQCPAVLVECGFLSNPEEAALLATEEYQNKLAFLLFVAIAETVGAQEK